MRNRSVDKYEFICIFGCICMIALHGKRSQLHYRLQCWRSLYETQLQLRNVIKPFSMKGKTCLQYKIGSLQNLFVNSIVNKILEKIKLTRISKTSDEIILVNWPWFWQVPLGKCLIHMKIYHVTTVELLVCIYWHILFKPLVCWPYLAHTTSAMYLNVTMSKRQFLLNSSKSQY